MAYFLPVLLNLSLTILNIVVFIQTNSWVAFGSAIFLSFCTGVCFAIVIVKIAHQ